ncbi:hypothetical protein QR685DRAFT_529715 [Neurospora intermedia]|uniref:Uncharacterized protein n=1 Tax=Neurospora intermedia TaxID=5142 RepID=A0ABR3D8S7_NEUIN
MLCYAYFHVVLCVLCPVHEPSVIHFYPIPPPIIISPKRDLPGLLPKESVRYIQMEQRNRAALPNLGEEVPSTTSHHNKLDTYYYTTHLLRV